jgi:CSLREA domain-containing protein
VLEESENDHLYPQNFQIIHKNDPQFLEELLTAIGKSLHISYQYRSSWFRTIASYIVRLSNYNDILAHRNQLRNYWSEPFSYLPWLLRELVMSFLVAFIFLVKNQVQNQSIEQTHADLKSFRVKYYPTMVIGASALLVLVFQVIALGLPQLLLLREILTPAAAATTFTVDSSADDVDFSPGDGVCDTNDGAGDGPCTLRAAIEEANAWAGTDTINFSIGH